MSLLFRIDRRVRLPGQDWTEYRLEAECRHFSDANAIYMRAQSRYEQLHPLDETGRRVQAEYRLVATASGDTLRTFIVGV